MACHAHVCFNLTPVFDMWTLLGDLAWIGQHVSYACQWHTRACAGFNPLLKGTVAWGGPPAQSAPHDASRENLRYPDPYYCYRRHMHLHVSWRIRRIRRESPASFHGIINSFYVFFRLRLSTFRAFGGNFCTPNTLNSSILHARPNTLCVVPECAQRLPAHSP
jgi:hypothetical protein